MKANKCSNCGLVNTASDIECRRCAHILFGERRERTHSPRQDARRFSLAPFLVIAALVAAGYFLLSGVTGVDKDLRGKQANSLPANQPAQLSRSEHEQRQQGTFFNAVQNSNGLKQADAHTNEINKLINGGSTPPK